MKTYTISVVNGKPDWETVPALHADTILWTPDHGIRMTQQLCYDKEALYVRQQAKESLIRAEHFAPLSSFLYSSILTTQPRKRDLSTAQAMM